jgi:hypothetical protein
VKVGPIGSLKTSIVNQPPLCNNTEDGRIQVDHSESLRSYIEANLQNLVCTKQCCYVEVFLITCMDNPGLRKVSQCFIV